jgi:hypothetical protein
LRVSQLVFIELLPVVVKTLEFLLVVVEDALNVRLLEDLFHEFLV